MTELFAGATSYWLVLAKSGGGTAGAVGGTCCPGGDGGAASWAVFLGSGDLARAVWRWSAAQGLRALGRFVDAGWQDSRAVYPNSPANRRSGIHRTEILPLRGVISVRSS